MEFPPIKHGGDPLSAPDVNKLTRGLREINSLIPRGITASAAGQDGVLRDVKYTETTNANAYGVVMLCDELLTDVAEVRRNSITEAIKPDLGNGSIDFGIAGVGGVIAGGVANVLVSGVSPVVVNIQNTSHEYADIQHASEFLTSGWQGRAKILWKETTTTGEQWAIVKFIAEEWEWRKIYSASGAVPASSFAEITGYDDDKKAFTVKQPSEDSLDATQVCISAATPMTASGQYSVAHVGYAPASVIHAGDTPSVGDDFGTKESSWDGEKDKTGFKACGVSGGRASVSPFSSKAGIYYPFDSRTNVNIPSTIITGTSSGDIYSNTMTLGESINITDGIYDIGLYYNDGSNNILNSQAPSSEGEMYGTVGTGDNETNVTTQISAMLYIDIGSQSIALGEFNVSGKTFGSGEVFPNKVTTAHINSNLVSTLKFKLSYTLSVYGTGDHEKSYSVLGWKSVHCYIDGLFLNKIA